MNSSDVSKITVCMEKNHLNKLISNENVKLRLKLNITWILHITFAYLCRRDLIIWQRDQYLRISAIMGNVLISWDPL